jgi:hypothetical protein
MAGEKNYLSGKKTITMKKNGIMTWFRKPL